MRTPRAELSRLALEAAQNPASAPDRVRQMLAELERVKANEETLPAGYLYAGAHRLLARFEEVAVEPLPTAQAPAIELWQTGNLPQTIRVPFDAICIGVAGSASIKFGNAGEENFYSIQASPDLRSIFAVGWNLDGNTFYQSDGEDTYVLPASTIVGTGRRPRRMAWELGSGRRIQVRVRNLLNVFTDGQVAAPGAFPRIRAEICFYLVRK